MTSFHCYVYVVVFCRLSSSSLSCLHVYKWECKTDMDNSYRFGRIEVSCEGYSHPGDDYILRGSCGLEYTLELTAEGRARGSGSHHGSKQSGGKETLGVYLQPCGWWAGPYISQRLLLYDTTAEWNVFRKPCCWILPSMPCDATGTCKYVWSG